MAIEFSHYELTPAKQLNKFSDLSKREGVLLRFDGDAFVDYHPWKHFGDPSIDQLIDDLRSQKETDLVNRLYELAKLDRERNSIKAQAFYNHTLYSDHSKSLSEKANVLKVKGSGDLETDKRIIHFCLENKIRMRLDYNNLVDMSFMTSLLKSLSPAELNTIDYIEDPFEFDLIKWKELESYGVHLALDRNAKNESFTQIWKPNIEVKPKGDKVILSSYMGHDLGRYHCYLELMKSTDSFLSNYHGIDTPHLYLEQKDLFLVQNEKMMINTQAINGMYKSLEERQWHSI